MIERWVLIRDGGLSRLAVIVLAALAVLALIVMVPLRLALGVANGSGLLAAREVAGTVWSGGVGDLQVGNLPLGNVYVGLRPLPLLLGRAEFALDRPSTSGQPQFHAAARGGDGGLVLKEASGELALAGLMAPLPVRSLTFSDFMMEQRDGSCVAAEGTVGLIVPALGPTLPNETILSGQAQCKNGALFVPMRGPSGTERLDLTLEPNGKWRADLALTGLPEEVSAPLLDMGFAERPDGIGLLASGSL